MFEKFDESSRFFRFKSHHFFLVTGYLESGGRKNKKIKIKSNFFFFRIRTIVFVSVPEKLTLINAFISCSLSRVILGLNSTRNALIEQNPGRFVTVVFCPILFNLSKVVN